jgi:hypothetical protein
MQRLAFSVVTAEHNPELLAQFKIGLAVETSSGHKNMQGSRMPFSQFLVSALLLLLLRYSHLLTCS